MLSRVIAAAVSASGEKLTSKRCGVCGDVAKSYHFGGLSCDSCKAFFRRSVQNEAFRLFQCAFHSRCDVTVASRKCCQNCRFQKCLAIGMEIGWVMTEEERMNMLRSRMEKQQKPRSVCNEATTTTPRKKRRVDPDGTKRRLWPPACAAANDPTEVDRLVRAFTLWFKLNGEDVEQRVDRRRYPGGKPKWLLVLLFIISIQKLVKFARCSRHFAAISLKDQMGLLRANVFEMFLVLHVHRGDARLFSACCCDVDEATASSCFCNRSDRDSRWRRPSFWSDAGKESPPADAICPFLTSVDDGSSFAQLLRRLIGDAPTLVLFLMVILFCPDSSSSDLRSTPDVQSCQMHFCHLLDKHLTSKWGREKSKRIFPKLLLLLPTLREIRDKHLFYRFDVGQRDFDGAFNAS